MKKYLKPQKIVSATVMTAIIFTLYSCATLLSGSSQEISVNTEPQGAKVSVNGKALGVLTPATVTVKRGKQAVYTFQKQGYEIGTVMENGSFNFVVFGNILLGGIIGLAVDASTGAIWQYNNLNVFYQFKEKNDSSDVTNPIIHTNEVPNRILHDDSNNRASEEIIIHWKFDSDPNDARIFWHVISNLRDQVNNTIERYLADTPYEEKRSFNIPGLTYENSVDVSIEIKIMKTGYSTQIRRYNVRQAIDQKEISDFFKLIKNDTE